MQWLAVTAAISALGAAAPCAAQTLDVSPALSQVVSERALPAPADPIADLIDRSAADDAAPIRWRTNEVQLAPNRDGAVDSMRVSVGGAQRGPIQPLHGGVYDEDYEVAYVRNWPGAAGVGKGRLRVDVSPHAGLGVGSAGGSAEAGAVVRLGRRADAGAARSGSGRESGLVDDGRWYLFAAASGRTGNFKDADWSRQGWSRDPTASMAATTQFGIGLRRGDMETSFGYARRQVKADYRLTGEEVKGDSLVALTFSIKPGR